MRKMPMQLKTMTLLVAILFILGVRGQLTIQILDARTVEVNNNVVVTCRDTTKSKAIQFAYQVANTAAYTDIVTCSRIIPCAIKDSTKHSAAKDFTNALYDEFILTLISYSASFNGNYKCWDLSNTSIDSDPMEMPYKVSLGKPCSSIIGCSVAHSVCTAGGTCECDSDRFQFENYCSRSSWTGWMFPLMKKY